MSYRGSVCAPVEEPLAAPTMSKACDNESRLKGLLKLIALRLIMLTTINTVKMAVFQFIFAMLAGRIFSLRESASS